MVQLQLESEKRASVIANYFSARRDDVLDLAESEVVVNFFNNRDLGMSFQYGLGVNVQLIEDRFERMTALKRNGGQPMYSGFLLLDRDGIPVAQWNRPENIRPMKEMLDPDGQVILTQYGQQSGELLVKAPVWINRVYQGELLAWIDVTASVALFSDLGTNRHFFLVDRKTGIALGSDNDRSSLAAQNWRLLDEASKHGHVARIILANGEQETLAITRVDIEKSPLSFVEISSADPVKAGFSRVFLIAAAVIPLIVLLLAFLDLRERRRLEALRESARIEAERLAQARSDFLANMSHEIRTPMNAIIGMTELCLDTQLEPKQRNYLSKIQRASDALLRIVNDVLDFSKIESGKLEIEKHPFDLDRVLEDIAALFSDKAGRKNIELVFDVDVSGTPVFIGDSLRFEQILINLIGNAIKFSEHGNIEVRIRSEMIDADSARLQCEVKDQGVGIPPEQQARLFTAFTQADATTTRRFGGSGLGLAICKRLVELMGGSIGVDSAPGEGSTFHFYIRLGVDLTQVSQLHLKKQQLAPFAHRPVLVIDDNPVSRSAIGAQLEQLGLKSELCSSGGEAMAAVAQIGAPEYLAVVVDFLMPEVDGVTVIRRLQGMWREGERPPPAILLTTHSHGHELLSVHGVFNTLLAKPTSASRLFSELAPLLGVRVKSEKRVDRHSKDAMASLRGLDVLLVDDVSLNQEVVRDMLEGAGVRVRLASNGLEAIEAATRSRPDCILMDCQMPVMDGYEATRRLRLDGRFGDLPIIAFTANALASEREHCREAGMDDYVTKPVKSGDLFSVLIKHLSARTDNTPFVEAVPETDRSALIDDGLLDLPGIDQQVGLHYIGGNVTHYHHLLSLFLDTTGREFGGGFNAALNNANWEEATRLVHSLKSSARLIGATHLGELASGLEAACHRRQNEAVEPLVGPLLQEFGRVCEGLSKLAPE